MSIPKIIHQTWKTSRVPLRWRSSVSANKRIYPDWEHRLWTDADMHAHVEREHPRFYPVFAGFERSIMRADVFRYVLMNDMGGVYCDLDYVFIRRFDFSPHQLVLSKEFDRDAGDSHDQVANYFFASARGHRFWADCLDSLMNDPPSTETYLDVIDATGPGFLTRVFEENRSDYQGVNLTPKVIFSARGHSPRMRREVLRNEATHGFHIGSNSWKERWTRAYWRQKLGSRP